MARGRRGLFRFGITLMVLSGLLIGVRSLLSSQAAADHVARRLQTLLGVPVRVGQVHIGLVGGSTLGKLQVFEADATSLAKPWLQIEEALADVSVFDLVRDAPLSSITFKGLATELRFDAEGKLLARLPAPTSQPAGAMAPLHIERGRFTLAQEGRPPLVVAGISGKVTGAGGKMGLQCDIDDPYWGKWRATGNLDLAAGHCSLRLVADSILVDQAMLEALPFVPATVWQQVRAEGVTPVDFTLALQQRPNQPPTIRYRVALEPENTSVYVASIGLYADHAKGTILVEDDRVVLRDVTGRSAGGEIHTSADLDFRAETSSLRFGVNVRDMVLRQLPQSWSVPPFDGLLTGKADLQLTVRDGQVRTGGRGEGVIHKARLPGPNLIQFKPIRLELKADGKRFRLDGASSILKTLLPPILPFLVDENLAAHK